MKHSKGKKDKRRILIVEDDMPTLESAVLKFSAAGFEVVRATDGQEGLLKLREDGPFSVVLLDLRMPHMDGFGFLEEKQKSKELRDVPVVVFSNFNQEEWVARAKRLGVVSYLLKADTSLHTLIREVEKIFHRQS